MIAVSSDVNTKYYFCVYLNLRKKVVSIQNYAAEDKKQYL